MSIDFQCIVVVVDIVFSFVGFLFKLNWQGITYYDCAVCCCFNVVFCCVLMAYELCVLDFVLLMCCLSVPVNFTSKSDHWRANNCKT